MCISPTTDSASVGHKPRMSTSPFSSRGPSSSTAVIDFKSYHKKDLSLLSLDSHTHGNHGHVPVCRLTARPPGLHGLLHRPKLHCKPTLLEKTTSVSLLILAPLLSASATEAAPTARSFSASPAPRTRSRPAPHRSSRASSPSPTQASRGWPSGSAWTATCRASTPPRCRASCRTRCGP